MENIKKAIDFIKGRYGENLDIGIVLGSGLGGLGEKIENPTIISYEDIPGFPLSTVEGHKGQLILGELGGKNVIPCKEDFIIMKAIH